MRFTSYFKVRGDLATLLPLESASIAKRFRMAQTAFLSMFPSDSRRGGAWPPLNTWEVPAVCSGTLDSLVVTLVVLLLWACFCLYRYNLSTNISRHRQKVVPLGLRENKQPLEAISTNCGYYRYWSSLTQFEVTSIQILLFSIEIARGGCTCVPLWHVSHWLVQNNHQITW